VLLILAGADIVRSSVSVSIRVTVMSMCRHRQVSVGGLGWSSLVPIRDDGDKVKQSDRAKVQGSHPRDHNLRDSWQLGAAPHSAVLYANPRIRRFHRDGHVEKMLSGTVLYANS
jgi:hypothetical protein